MKAALDVVECIGKQDPATSTLYLALYQVSSYQASEESMQFDVHAVSYYFFKVLGVSIQAMSNLTFVESEVFQGSEGVPGQVTAGPSLLSTELASLPER